MCHEGHAKEIIEKYIKRDHDEEGSKRNYEQIGEWKCLLDVVETGCKVQLSVTF